MLIEVNDFFMIFRIWQVKGLEYVPGWIRGLKAGDNYIINAIHDLATASNRWSVFSFHET